MRIRSWAASAAIVAVVAAACTSGDGGDGDAQVRGETEITFAGDLDVSVAAGAGCDFLDASRCLFPFPSDHFTVADEATLTGRRVEIASEATPVNADGRHVDTTEWNRSDGFSPGSPVMTLVPGVDLAASGAPTPADLARSLDDDSPTVIVDLDTGERVPHWAELDANVADPAQRPLLLHPAVALREGHRHAVALRHLVDATGTPIEAAPAFRAYRDRLRTEDHAVEARREAMEATLTDLAATGVERDDLYLAWDFTVASAASLSGRMLSMRDEAFEQLGEAAPAFAVTEVVEGTDARVARRVKGTFQVPLYLTGEGEPGSRLNLGSDGLPEATGKEYTASFDCVIPRSALAEDGAARPARPVVYGHGLLGSNDEIGANNIADMTNEHRMVYCATNWIGMSEEDIGNAIAILQDLSGFPSLPDRGQQGILNTLFLGRLMIHEDGLRTDAAFQGADGEPVLDDEELFYDGNSQGAIIGGAATAVAQDWTRAVLGVGGMNYSVLLQRSVDFDSFALVLGPSYPDPVDRTLGIALIQMVWDRAETNGYAQHLTTDPYPGTPEHRILMHVAFGDWQVTQFQADVQARTIGAQAHCPSLADGRSPGALSLWNVGCIDEYPFDGSAIVYWDSGAPAPPLANVPPREGYDPHEDPRADADARRQKSEFLRPDGRVVDVCEGSPCTATYVG